MTNTKAIAHTPGPWLVEGRLVYALHHKEDYKEGKPLLVNRFSARIEVTQGCSHDEAVANTHLIAAAPDLLATLKALLALEVTTTWWDEGPASEGWQSEKLSSALARAQAAVAKAEGALDE